MSIIITSEAKCRDCYKCIRYCQVKAISINNEQAQVVEDRCILCGKCIEVCPQQAREVVSYIDEFERYLQGDERVIVSLAPSFLAATTFSTPWKIVAGLKELGVDRIEETALGAEIISSEYQKYYKQNDKTIISSCCPTIVKLIEKYYPGLIAKLAPLVSPMIAHARMIKNRFGEECKVIFIGPCISKRDEPDWGDQDNPVDLVLDFEEVVNYFKEKGINPDKLTDAFPELPSSQARLYPLERGILKVAGIKDTLTAEVISVSGIDEARELFEDMEKGLIKPAFVEALACKGGCIGGPAMANDLSVYFRKKNLNKYLQELPANSECSRTKEMTMDLKKEHQYRKSSNKMPSEKEIRDILALIGKFTPEDETNCGGCGYPSCREKAIAVYQGLAQPEMCVSYMREKAESLSHVVVDTSINGIVIVDENMIIQEFNPTANRMFNRRGKKWKGKPLSVFVDPADYEYVWETREMIVEKYKEYPQYGLITRESIYPLEKYGVVIAIISDVTKEEKRKNELNNMKHEALDRASQVIQKQMQVAQEIAGLLGESTAETKATLLELIEIMNKKEAKASGDES